MKTDTERSLETTVAATVGPEDVSCGDYVALASVIYELPSYLWPGRESLPAGELVRLRLTPSGAGTPLKVFAICLPFVYAKNASGEVQTLDLRREQIVRLDRASAKAVWKQLKPADSPITF